MMGMIVRVRAGIAGIAQLHLQGNINSGIRKVVCLRLSPFAFRLQLSAFDS